MGEISYFITQEIGFLKLICQVFSQVDNWKRELQMPHTFKKY